MPSDAAISSPQASGHGKRNKRKKGSGKQKGAGADDRQKPDATDAGEVNETVSTDPSAPAKDLPNGSHHAQPDNVDIADSEDHDDNGDSLGATEQLESKAASLTINDVNDTGKAATPSSLESDPRFEALVRDRDSLRAEVAEMRRSLEEIQSKHDEEMNTMQKKLEDTTTDKEHAESQFRNLLGKVNTIKSQLGERLKADAEELSRTRTQIEELEGQNDTLRVELTTKSSRITELEDENTERTKELSILRNRMNLSQQNWLKEREDLLDQEKYLRAEFEEAKQAMHNWEILAMEERSVRENLSDKVADLEEQLAGLKDDYERATSESATQASTVDGLQRALQELQTARKQELRELVETSDAQIEDLKRKLHDTERRATEASSALEAAEKELQRALPFEKEVKEKNLLIGKLRHEAVTLNEHLTKALRFLKKGKPEDNVDRHIVTNHLLHFLILDRSDPKKFQVLQLIAALLGWNDEQREQAGLARPGTSSTTLKVPSSSPINRTPSSPALSSDYFTDTGSNRKESLAELWSNFLDQEAQTGPRRKDSRSETQSENPKSPF